MASLVSTESVLRLPVGGKTALSELIAREGVVAETLYVVHSGTVPDFYSFLNSDVNWIDIGAPGKTIGHSVAAALGKILHNSTSSQEHNGFGDIPARIVFADTFTSLNGLDKVAVGITDVSEDWTFAPYSFSSEVIQGRATVSSQRIIAGAFSLSRLRKFEGILASAILSHDSLFSADPFFEAMREYSTSLDEGLTEFLDKEWQDLGHKAGYLRFRQSRLEGREFNSFVVGPGGLFVSKSSSRREKLNREANWFKEVPAGLLGYLPRVILGGEDHYEVQYINALTLAEKVLYGEPHLLDLSFATKKIDEWFSATAHSSGMRVSDKDQEEHGAEILHWLRENLSARLEEVEANKAIFGSDAHTIRQTTILARNKIGSMGFPSSVPAIVHGDLILSNILVDERDATFKLIDPRGGFGEASCLGLQIYDWAKLAQSIFGRYEEIVGGEFEFINAADSLRFSTDEGRLRNYAFMVDWFMKSCPNPQAAKELGGLLMISAVPFHLEDPKRAFAMIIAGRELASL
jgi:hypothetical protein